MAWWNELSTTQQVLWAIGTFSSVLLILQLGLSFFGLEHQVPNLMHDSPDGHADAPDSHDLQHQDSHHLPLLEYFTVRNATAFLTGVGWGSLMLISWGSPEWLAVMGGIIQGLGFAAVVMLLMWFLASLASSGSISLENAIDHQGEVTLAIPGHGNGFGKMMLSIQGQTIEIEAYTPGDTIGRGTRVRVVRVQGRNMLFVEPIITVTP
jgi:membrane protein implicated in regulation of membrane protease activity